MNGDREPNWLSISEILAVHEKILALFGGAAGVRDHTLLESALGRPRNLWAYEHTDLIVLAATYADGIVNNNPFIDGNKRTGFLAAALFLETNGGRFKAAEVEVVTMTLGLADKSLDSAQYADWLRLNTQF